VDNGKASSTSSSKVTETMEITCDDGYKKIGTSATCSPDGPNKAAWKNVPKCEAVSCPAKKIPNSDKEDVITGKVGEAVLVKCNGASDSFAITCTAVGPETAFWSGFVSCQETPADMCPALTVDNGKASSNSASRETQTVEITCDDGYKKIGTSAVCSSAGSGKVAWTNIPTCEAVSCPIKKIPNSDKKDGITGKVGDAVSVKCSSATEPFALKCIGVSPGKAIWAGFATCAVTPDDMCGPLVVAYGKASTTSFTKLMGKVNVICNNGSPPLDGKTAALCSPGPNGGAVWKDIPQCPAPLQPMAAFSKQYVNGATFAALSTYLWAVLLFV